MKERPILFNSEKVNAVSEGRKTQTRRIVKKQIEKRWNIETNEGEITVCRNDHDKGYPCKYEFFAQCPYGKIGDQLVDLFRNLWDSINGKPRKDGVDISWEANPYVWVVSFRKI